MKLMSDAERVRELEAMFPGLEFTRFPADLESEYAGQPIGWGMVPEQATGLLDGNPFYYRFRGNCGSLSVWDGRRFTVDSVPSYNVIPILSASVTSWFPGDDYAGATKGVGLFKYLMETLVRPTGEETYPGRLSASAADSGLATALDVRAALQKDAPAITYPEREVEWGTAPELVFDLSNLGHVALRWYGFSGDCVTVVLYAPSDDVVASGKAVGFSSYNCDRMTSEEIVRGFLDSWDSLSWEHDASYSNHWDHHGLRLVSRFADNRPDLKERHEREYGLWLERVQASIIQCGDFLRTVRVEAVGED